MKGDAEHRAAAPCGAAVSAPAVAAMCARRVISRGEGVKNHKLKMVDKLSGKIGQKIRLL